MAPAERLTDLVLADTSVIARMVRIAQEARSDVFFGKYAMMILTYMFCLELSHPSGLM
ncbi:hypothetical protein XGA_4368 [Xanthomonas hortorum ATCC 19865]|nr:hypothetical protein XGA_4368 [Xanthomonas hortorum ATCC 19865]